MWIDDQQKAAIAAIDEGQSMKKATRDNNIPYSSLRDWYSEKTRYQSHGTKGVLSIAEESELVIYFTEMYDRGYGLSPSALKMKVYEITKIQWLPFCNGILGVGWMRWFKQRHPKLIVRSLKGLESARTRALCSQNVSTLYDNLESLYAMHNYLPKRIWNCDESGAQVGNIQAIGTSMQSTQYNHEGLIFFTCYSLLFGAVDFLMLGYGRR